MKYQETVKGTFEETHQVEANSEEEAKEALAGNTGNMIDSTALETLEVSNLQEVAEDTSSDGQ